MKKLFLCLSISIIGLIQLNTQTLFPDKCIGKWEGQMHIYYNSVLTDSVKVLFSVAKTEDLHAWIWKTEYLSEKQPVIKDYVLSLVDTEKQLYILDEGDGIHLYSYLFGNKLYCVFETQELLLTSTYEFINDQLIFEITSGKKLEADNKDIFNYSVNHVQRVMYKRLK